LSVEFTAEIAAHVEEGIIALNRDERVTFMNRAAVRMLGWEEAQLRGWPLRPLIDVSQTAAGRTPGTWGLLRDVIARGRTLHVADAEFMRCDGSPLAVAFSASPLVRDGRIHGAVVSFHDISRQKALAAALERRALHDALTDLPNRVLLRDRLEQALLAARRVRRGRWRCYSSTSTASRRSTTRSATTPATHYCARLARACGTCCVHPIPWRASAATSSPSCYRVPTVPERCGPDSTS
jgi:PAS domain S-box-containing protein